MSFPKIGNLAPSFSLNDQNGSRVSLKDLRDQKNVVVYFYPKAMTPGCTLQAGGLRDSAEALAKKSTVVLGISPDSCTRLAKFAERDGLNFTLLSDEDHSVADKYGAWGPKKFMGKEYEGIHRISFLIDPQGKIQKIWPKVKPEEHAAEVLAAIQG